MDDNLEDISCYKVSQSGADVPKRRDDEDPDCASLFSCLIGDGGVGGQEQSRLTPTQLVDDVKPKPFYNLIFGHSLLSNGESVNQ